MLLLRFGFPDSIVFGLSIGTGPHPCTAFHDVNVVSSGNGHTLAVPVKVIQLSRKEACDGGHDMPFDRRLLYIRPSHKSGDTHGRQVHPRPGQRIGFEHGCNVYCGSLRMITGMDRSRDNKQRVLVRSFHGIIRIRRSQSIHRGRGRGHIRRDIRCPGGDNYSRRVRFGDEGEA